MILRNNIAESGIYMKRIIGIITALCVLLSGSISAYALSSSGSCGANVTYSFNSSTGTVIISGSGPMEDTDESPFLGELDIIHVVIGSGVTTVGEMAFLECEELRTVTLPRSVTSVGYAAFANCSELSEVYYEGTQAEWNGISINSAGNDDFLAADRHYNYSTEVSLYDYTVLGNGAIEITGYHGEDASVVIPSEIDGYSVTRIGEEAFSGHMEITDVTVPSGVTSIGALAFNECESLQSITLPTTLSAVYTAAFANCAELGDIYYAGTEVQWNGVSVAVSGNDEFLSATVHYNSLPVCTEHTWNAGTVLIQPTCTSAGRIKYACTVCGTEKTETLPLAEHAYVNTVVAPTCAHMGYTERVCSVCGYSCRDSFTAYASHNYANTVVSATPDARGYTEHICSVCGYSYIDGVTGYASDDGALSAVITRTSYYSAQDYSAASFSVLSDKVSAGQGLSAGNNPQQEIDNAVSEILSAISDLDPYLNLTVTYQNGSVEVDTAAQSVNGNTYSVLFGEEVTLTATPDEGYEFAGWYDTVSSRIFSEDAEYTFKLTSNKSFVARFVKAQTATLFFKNDTGFIKSKTTRTVSQWNALTSLSALLPEVPYKYGGVNGRWVYDEAQVLSLLRSGEDADITAQYDSTGAVLPALPAPDTERGIPALTLSYYLDAENDVGSFIMAAGIPDGCALESAGIAFYYKSPNEFNPVNFDVTINNKMTASTFEPSAVSDYYTVNVKKFTAAYNWTAKGYVTYYDSAGNLKTAYSNQINVVNRQQV